MKPSLGPLDAAHRFSFAGNDCLYRDHHGRRVIADAEGSGSFLIERAEASFLTYADEVGSDLFRGTYRSSLTVCALDEGLVEVTLKRGTPPTQVDSPETASGDIQGAGWIISAQAPLDVDDKREPAPVPSEDLPIPFFRNARSEGEMRIVRSTTGCRLIDSFHIGDEAALKERDFKVQNISDVTLLDGFFPNGQAHAAQVASHLNTASWNCPVPPNCQGLILRKTYDRFHGRQRARVLVDGEVTGWWYEPVEDRLTRWGIADFGIEATHLQGKEMIRLAIDPPPGTPLWSVSQIEVFALEHPED